jgi:hypothetical protein
MTTELLNQAIGLTESALSLSGEVEKPNAAAICAAIAQAQAMIVIAQQLAELNVLFASTISTLDENRSAMRTMPFNSWGE